MEDIIRRVLAKIGSPGECAANCAPLVAREEALVLAMLPQNRNLDILSLASAARTAFAPTFFTCAIINAKSGLCAENCAFCAQSAHHNAQIAVYPFVDEYTILQKAESAARAGVRRFGIVASGTSIAEKNIVPLCRAVEKIISQTGLSICASLGLASLERARKFKDAGISRYHHNLETAASYFSNICSTHAYEKDIATVKAAKAAGLEVCCGGILGLGENWEQRVELAFTLAELNVDSIPINFLNAIPGTRLENMPKLRSAEALRAVGIFRLINPSRDILVAGGRTHVLGELQSWIYAAGANGLMTGDYLTTSGPGFIKDQDMLRDLGVE